MGHYDEQRERDEGKKTRTVSDAEFLEIQSKHAASQMGRRVDWSEIKAEMPTMEDYFQKRFKEECKRVFEDTTCL